MESGLYCSPIIGSEIRLMRLSRNARLAYGVRFSTLPLFSCHMTSMEIDSLFQRHFCRLADSEKRIYRCNRYLGCDD